MTVPKMLVAIVGLAIWQCGGCCHVQPPQPPFVPVREAIYRTELSTTNRLALPLTPAAHDFLLKFLKSGRNPAMDRDATIADAQATERYSGLLELLRRPEYMSVTNLVVDEKFSARPAFRPWFPDRAVRQVVDAHEEWPPVRQPFAFLDRSKRNWWVFYHERKTLTHVMVTRALEPTKSR